MFPLLFSFFLTPRQPPRDVTADVQMLMVLLFLLAPLLSSPVGLLGALPPLIQFYMLFLAWPAPVFIQQFFSLPPPFLLWTPKILFKLFSHCSSTPSPLSLFSLPSVSLFLVPALICNLWMYPFMLSFSGPPASLRGSSSLGLRGVTPGWGISLLPYLLLPSLSYSPFNSLCLSISISLPYCSPLSSFFPSCSCFLLS